ncbi:hypothetical protein WMY93_032862 [Mugilogobius chulae]|uniref:Uncharacterized protein n=1 Tax=Mugilogobius chulae TaxID=88201 RepID=A0AAW0MIL5_9GOBI
MKKDVLNVTMTSTEELSPQPESADVPPEPLKRRKSMDAVLEFGHETEASTQSDCAEVPPDRLKRRSKEILEEFGHETDASVCAH